MGLGNYAQEQKKEEEIFNNVEDFINTKVKEITGEKEIKYFPEGNTEYSKEHKVTVTINEELKSLKYQWVQEGKEPIENKFIEITNKEEIITQNEVSGIWYVYFLIETLDEEQKLEKTKAFYFDNEGPTVELIAEPISEKSYKLIATATRGKTQIKKYDFYKGDTLLKSLSTNDETASHIVENTETGEQECRVIVTDMANNEREKSVTARTKLYTWEKWNIRRIYTMTSTLKKEDTYFFSKNYDIYRRDSVSGSTWKLNLVAANVDWKSLNNYQGCYTISDDKTEVLHMKSITSTNPNNKCITVNVYSSSTFKSEESKGTTKVENVNSSKITTWPKDAICGSYYYVYTGLE